MSDNTVDFSGVKLSPVGEDTEIEQRPFSRLDIAFARFLCQRTDFDPLQKQAFETIVMTVSYEQNQGHSCIQIDDNARVLLFASGLVEMNPENQANPLPLVIEQNRLYLHRYWNYENRLAMQIKAMSQAEHPIEKLDAMLDRYFADAITEIDDQREAAKMAAKQSFSIITGGPGTGKTFTVVKILALLQELTEQPLHIALAAPTGKAAMRLQESIGFSKAKLPCAEAIKNSIPETVTTLHRLLGAMPPSPYFRHHADKPLVYDLVVVDEASMVDLALMSKLLDALKPGARLILLGDKDQLASVESGAVLADLAMAETLQNNVYTLKKSHRFGGAIKELAEAVNLQQAELAWQILSDGADGAVQCFDAELIDYVAAQQADYLQLAKADAEFERIFQAFSRFQVLCSNRQGKNSVADINYRVEQKLAEQKRIDLSGLWYPGRPVMVTQNNPALHLYNGDIGICMQDSFSAGKLMVFFQRADGSVKKYLPARVPHCETVFAMTIHKSQGSEFEEVLIVLPEAINPVLTKELLYTAITRAKKTIKLVAGEAVFTATVRQKIERVTGLVDKFKG
ncbi:MAG: exodeoxyribonuclease V subunit alpha [Methylobacter sp.]|uniref:exodeoxyribonuclease V subunit alpha n=1 Tax=Methylobacter sp. TaxID=2051955 RepID=UPI00272FAE4E|nr:exodeoxyribonuclease V subunit alpha [Methylobacter sp.]MDP1664795.1 exodeoxyribonuclease V subunit alpha [Methylobacter sp.]MDP1971295.1 exodeoxyribonuclease V subunit alpha [Methylobacter sp.]